MNRYYVYLHRRLLDNKVFYVGKGSGNRAWNFQNKGRSLYWKRTALKYGVSVEIVFENLTEDEAFQCEIDTILEMKYFGEPLCNLTSGGEGSSGLNFTDSQRLKISESLKGRTPWNLGLKQEKQIEYKTSEQTRKIQSELKKDVYNGIRNPFADKNKYWFVRLSDGFEVLSTRQELCENFNADSGLIKKLFYSKNPRKSASGWRLKRNQDDNKES